MEIRIFVSGYNATVLMLELRLLVVTDAYYIMIFQNKFHYLLYIYIDRIPLPFCDFCLSIHFRLLDN